MATLLLIALLIVFAKYDQKALSQWSSRLSLNTIIAVVTQLAQMTLLLPIAQGISQLKWLWYCEKKPVEDMSYFQEGSTGPVSSFILLFKHRASLFVWLGVTSMILQILSGPFAQQALSLPTRRIEGDNGSILRIASYETPNGSDSVVRPDGSGTTFSFQEVVSDMKLAIETGLLRDGVSASEVQASCRTGNCTFGIYMSMGICTSVDDVTPTLIVHCPKGGNNTVPDNKCNYTVPEFREHPPFSETSYEPAGQPGNTLFIGASEIGGTHYQYSGLNTLVDFYVIYLPDLTTLTLDAEVENNYTANLAALKCTLSLCLYTYNSSMEFGITTTTVLRNDTDLSWKEDSIDIDHTLTPIITVTPPDNSEAFYMTNKTFNGLSSWLGSATFTGIASMCPAAALSTNNAFTTTASRAIASHLYGSEVGEKVANGVESLSNLINNVAMSMTNG